MINIIGATGRVNTDEVLRIAEEYSLKWNLDIILFNADLVFGREHLVSSYEHAKRAFESETNISRKLATEIILYASGERQISRAIDKMGLRDGLENVAIAFTEGPSEVQISELLNTLKMTRNDDVLMPDEGNLATFGITELELKTVPEGKRSRLVLERVTFVELLK